MKSEIPPRLESQRNLNGIINHECRLALLEAVELGVVPRRRLRLVRRGLPSLTNASKTRASKTRARKKTHYSSFGNERARAPGPISLSFSLSLFLDERRRGLKTSAIWKKAAPSLQ